MASAPSPSVPAKDPAATVSPTSSQTSSSSSTPPTVSTQPPSMSLPNATPDLPAPPVEAPPPTSSSPPVLSSPPPASPPPAPPLSSPPPLTITLSPPPPDTTVPSVSAPPPQTTTPSPPVTTSPPPPSDTVASPPPPVPVSSPPPSTPTTKSPPVPVPDTPAQSPPPPTSTPSSSPPPKTKSPVAPSRSSPPPSTPLSTSPPLPSPSTNPSVAKSPPMPSTEDASSPVSQFPLASPTSTTPSQNGTVLSPSGPGISRNSNTGSQGSSHSSGQGGGEGLSAGAAASIAIVVVFLVASFIVAGVWYVKKKRRPADGYNSVFVVPSPMMTSPKTGDGLSPLGQATTTPFTTYHSNYTSGSLGPKASLTDISLGNSKYFMYEELHEITNGFSASNILGEGGFGCVYKGQLQDGREVAVKRLTSGGGQGEREFQAEVEIISRVHHRHLVSLVGYCIQNEQRLLVYDYVPNNTLHYHLHGRGRPVLEWAIRVKIAAGAAHGIAYLHEDCHPRIIHRDIKSSNILLDNDFEALVADFGLARLALDAVTHVTTRVMGTFGYLAPEYASSGKLTERSDVFSFGVVLLELITGRKPVDTSRPLGDESLVEWARPLLSQALETGKLEELIDPKLEKNYNEVEMLRMIEAAAACVRHSASRRPRMSQVVRVLDSLADVDLTNGVQPGKSELFNVANSAEIRLFQKMAFGSQDYDYSSEFSQVSTSSTAQLNPNNRRDYHNLL